MRLQHRKMFLPFPCFALGFYLSKKYCLILAKSKILLALVQYFLRDTLSMLFLTETWAFILFVYMYQATIVGGIVVAVGIHTRVSLS